jgi:transposase
MNDDATQTSFAERFQRFLGFDWARQDHDVVVVNAAGRIVLELTIPDTADGWARLRRKLGAEVDEDFSAVAVAVETRNGPAVERLLEMGCCVFPLNPKSAQRYRERKVPAGAKSDRLDAWSFADALRTDGHGWRALVRDDPLTEELRLLCRDEVGLIQRRTALICQLREALHAYYPAALEAFDDWTCLGAWAFVERFATPQRLVRAGKRRWDKFLHSHRLYRPETYARRMEIFARADQFCGGVAVTRAKSRLAVAVVRQLRVLQKQIDDYRKAIEELFARHPDHDIFGSLPGAGDKLAPRLLAELGDDRRRFRDAQALQCYAGTAPVTRQSGKNRWVKLRTACNKTLRYAVHLWADLSRHQCVWADVYYQHKKAQGMSHACALRCLGQRWLKILWKMWETRTRYDENLHLRNQLKHGSWTLTVPQEQPVGNST